MSNDFHGLMVLDKPLGITSRAALDRAAHWFSKRTSIGHAGTLDPLATGVLVMCVGQATRLTEFVQDMEKSYNAEFVLGARSDTDDAEGPIEVVPDGPVPTRTAIESVLRKFIGVVRQAPPAFSAAKIEGQRAYKKARRGAAVELPSRPVNIHDIELLDYSYPMLKLTVRCGKGTYIRSLARDIGAELGCGGYVLALRRTRIGSFTVADAVGLETEAGPARARLLPLCRAVEELPRMEVTAEKRTRLQHGRAIDCDPTSVPPAGDRIAIFDDVGRFVAIGQYDVKHRRIKPVKVFGQRGPR